jgi:hypothetical protein
MPIKPTRVATEKVDAEEGPLPANATKAEKQYRYNMYQAQTLIDLCCGQSASDESALPTEKALSASRSH